MTTCSGLPRIVMFKTKKAYCLISSACFFSPYTEHGLLVLRFLDVSPESIQNSLLAVIHCYVICTSVPTHHQTQSCIHLGSRVLDLAGLNFIFVCKNIGKENGSRAGQHLINRGPQAIMVLQFLLGFP